MEITFLDLRNKEVINLFDGKRLGRIIDLSIEKETGKVVGFILPSPKKLFKKSEDLFLPLSVIKKIGEDVILVRLSPEGEEKTYKNPLAEQENKTYARYRRVPNKER